MKWFQLLLACLILAAGAFAAGSDEISQDPNATFGDRLLDRISDRIYAQLETLFDAYYPKAVGANRHKNGIRFEYDVTTYDFPRVENPGELKHENTRKRGPKKGGILCNVYLNKGKYRGPLAMAAPESTTLGPMFIDRKIYKTMLMARYSAKHDAHLYVALSYPPDAIPEFITEFVSIITAFETQQEIAAAQGLTKNSRNVLEGRLRVHPKFHYRYYVEGFGDGQECALFNADDRLKQIEPGSLVRVRGVLASKLFGGDPNSKAPRALAETWIIYMIVHEIEILQGPPSPKSTVPPTLPPTKLDIPSAP